MWVLHKNSKRCVCGRVCACLHVSPLVRPRVSATKLLDGFFQNFYCGSILNLLGKLRDTLVIATATLGNRWTCHSPRNKRHSSLQHKTYDLTESNVFLTLGERKSICCLCQWAKLNKVKIECVWEQCATDKIWVCEIITGELRKLGNEKHDSFNSSPNIN
jgi:hypothetical protein